MFGIATKHLNGFMFCAVLYSIKMFLSQILTLWKATNYKCALLFAETFRWPIFVQNDSLTFAWMQKYDKKKCLYAWKCAFKSVKNQGNACGFPNFQSP